MCLQAVCSDFSHIKIIHFIQFPNGDKEKTTTESSLTQSASDCVLSDGSVQPVLSRLISLLVFICRTQFVLFGSVHFPELMWSRTLLSGVVQHFLLQLLSSFTSQWCLVLPALAAVQVKPNWEDALTDWTDWVPPGGVVEFSRCGQMSSCRC